MINKLIIVLFLTSMVTGLCHGKLFDQSKLGNLSLGIGTWQEYYMQVQDSQSGALNSFEIKPYLSAALDYQLIPNHFLATEVGYILRDSYSESNYTKDHFFWRFDYVYQALAWLRLRAGTSFMWQSLSGDGSEETLPNGDSEETYYAPDKRKNIFNQTFDFGVEFLHKNMSARLQSYIYALDEEDERLTSLSLSFHYLIPIREL